MTLTRGEPGASVGFGTPETAVPHRDGDRFMGREVGRYRIDARVGEDAWARAYAARHQRTGRRVVVRILHPKLAADRSRLALCFEQAERAQTAGHPHVVPLLEFDVTAQGHAFRVSPSSHRAQDTHDETLEAMLRAGPLSPARAAALGQQILSGLLAAEAEGVVHGALSPSAIRIVTDAHGISAQVDHFGLSAFPLSRLEDSRLAHVIRYIAPERLVDGRFNVRSDIYAVGVMLYEMLAGVAPFSDVGAEDLARAITTEEPRKLRDLRPELRVSLVKIVNRAMRKSPEERYGTLTEMLDALSPASREQGDSSRPPPPLVPVDRVLPPREPAPERLTSESSLAAAPAHVLDRAAEPPPKTPLFRYTAMAMALVGGVSVVALSLGTPKPARLDRSETTSGTAATPTPVDVKAAPVEASPATRVPPSAAAAPPAVVRATPPAAPQARPRSTPSPSAPNPPTRSTRGSALETPLTPSLATPPTTTPPRKVRTSADLEPY